MRLASLPIFASLLLCGCPVDPGDDTTSGPGSSTTTGTDGSTGTSGAGDESTGTSGTTGTSETGSETTTGTGGETTTGTGGETTTGTSGEGDESGTTGAPGCAAEEFAVVGPVAVTPGPTSMSMYDPPLALSPDGHPVIAWQGGGFHEIRWRAFDAALAPLTAVELAIQGSAHAPALGVADDGRFMVAWGDPGQGPRVMFRLHGADGAPLGPATQANVWKPFNTPLIGGTGISGAMNGAGVFALVWTEGDERRILVRRFASDGAPLGGQFEVDPDDFRFLLGPPAVAIDDAGRVLVVWGDMYTGQQGYHAQHFGADQQASGPRVTLYQPGEGLFYPPTVGMAADGRAVVAYYLQDAGQVVVQRFAADGALVGAPTQANDVAAADPLAVDSADPHAGTLAVADDGSFVVGWISAEPEQYIRRFAADGAPLGPSVPLCSPYPPRGAPSLAVGGGSIAVGQVLLNPDTQPYVTVLTP